MQIDFFFFFHPSFSFLLGELGIIHTQLGRLIEIIFKGLISLNICFSIHMGSNHPYIMLNKLEYLSPVSCHVGPNFSLLLYLFCNQRTKLLLVFAKILIQYFNTLNVDFESWHVLQPHWLHKESFHFPEGEKEAKTDDLRDCVLLCWVHGNCGFGKGVMAIVSLSCFCVILAFHFSFY